MAGSLDRLRTALAQVPAVVALLRGDNLAVELVSPPDADLAPYLELARRVLSSGEPARGWESPAPRPDGGEAHWDFALVPLRDAAGAVDGVLLHAVDVARLVESRRRAEEAEHRYTTLSEANVVGVTITGERAIVEANDAFLAMIGRTREELAAGLDWTELTAPEYAGADERALRALRETGAVSAYEKEYVRADGTRVPVLLSGSRLQEEPLLVLATLFDLTERKAAEREVSHLLSRTERLQEITAGLSASNSAGEIARTVVHDAVEDLSASAGLLLRSEDGDAKVAHAIGLARDRVEEWRQFPTSLPGAVGRAMALGEATEVDPADVAADLGGGSAFALPLLAGGRVLGVLLLAFRDGRELTGADHDFLSALTRQAAAALDRVRLYENRAYVARKLQEGLLPQRLADVPGAEVAVVYESISGGGEVGGDFYDVFKAGPGRWAVAVGDVCGKGTEAAVITGLARHTVRAVARLQDDPAMMLGFLNAALRSHGDPPAYCTVGCALLDVADGGGLSARLSSGGHPYPILVRADGSVEEVRISGTMLGVAEDPTLEEVRVEIAPGDALVMYTDGVVDARQPRGERFGEARLVAALERAAGGSAGEQAAAVEAAVRAHAPGAPADDRAIVVLRANVR